MVIDLSSIGTNPRPIDIRVDPADIDLTDEILTLAGELMLTGEIHRENHRVVLNATLEGETSIPCSRCLEAVSRRVEVKFRDVFVESSPEGAEAELNEEQLDESISLDGTVDLTDVAREQLLLATPEQVFCQDDCKGLCPKCGANLNLIDCNCADDEVDPRWAALKNLK